MICNLNNDQIFWLMELSFPDGFSKSQLNLRGSFVWRRKHIWHCCCASLKARSFLLWQIPSKYAFQLGYRKFITPAWYSRKLYENLFPCKTKLLGNLIGIMTNFMISWVCKLKSIPLFMLASLVLNTERNEIVRKWN